MSGKSGKTVLVAFKVESELAELLNRLPNKSAYIRNAIAAQLGMSCPLCDGKGTVACSLYEHYKPLIDAERRRACIGCGDELSLPSESEELAPQDRVRLEQFFHGGPLYCASCFHTAPPCEKCGWHVDEERLADHQRSKHSAEA